MSLYVLSVNCLDTQQGQFTTNASHKHSNHDSVTRRLFEISNKVTTPTSPLAKRCLRRVKQQAYSLLTARVTSDKVVAYNIARTSLDNKPPFGNSWIDLHERATGLRRDQQKCAVLGCNKAVTLGAHVEVVGQHEDMR